MIPKTSEGGVPSCSPCSTPSHSSPIPVQSESSINNKRYQKNQKKGKTQKNDPSMASDSDSIQSINSVTTKVNILFGAITRSPPPLPMQWVPRPILPMATHASYPLYQLLRASDLQLIHQYCQGEPLTKIIRSARQPNIYLTTRDIRQLITHNTQTYHELLILALKAICHQFGGTYLDPSFFPNLESQGWNMVKRCFAHKERNPSKPSLSSDIILIPIHIRGNHWIALGKRVIGGNIHFFYSDDLNAPSYKQ